MPETTISSDTGVITLINVFTCAEPRQNELVAALDSATTEFFAQQPGHICTIVHASMDKTRVVYYAQWASMAYVDDLQNNREAQDRLSTIMTIAESSDPRLCDVRSVHQG
jgi:hypothetical protein